MTVNRRGYDARALLELLDEALESHEPTSREEADAAFEQVERVHEEFQRKLQATIPTYADKQVVYNL